LILKSVKNVKLQRKLKISNNKQKNPKRKKRISKLNKKKMTLLRKKSRQLHN